MFAQVIWLLFSHGMLVGIGGALLSAGLTTPGVVLLAGTPVLRIALRFRATGGYYLIGYAGEVGGDLATPSGTITRRSAPLRFSVLLGLEIALIAMLWLAVFLRH